MSIFFHETGKDTQPTIVFIHGGNGAGWMWNPQIVHFEDFHCLIPDLPEHGQSADEMPFSINHSADLIADLIRTRAHGGKAHVVGISIGAQITVALLAKTPDLVESAIVSSALVRPVPGSSMLTRGLISLSYRWFVAPFKNSEWWVKVNMKYAAGVPDSFYTEFRKSFQSTTKDAFTNVMMDNQHFRIPSGLERVQCPTLIICGKNEYGVMRQSVNDLKKVIPNSQAYVVVHTKKMSTAEEHNWNMTAPVLFNHMVRSWIANRPLPLELKPMN